MKETACPAAYDQAITPLSKTLQEMAAVATPVDPTFSMIRRYCELPAPHKGRDHEFCTKAGVFLWHD
jgi:hypothetical protein